MLTGRIALVTGGGTGIGKAIALSLCRNGAKVAIASRNRARLEHTAAELGIAGYKVLPVQMDLRDKSDVHRAVAEVISQWGAIHILVNNAGISGLSLMSRAANSSPVSHSCFG